MNIQIFKKEIEDNLADLIKSSASIAYCSQASIGKKEEFVITKQCEENIKKCIAQNNNQIDLYYLESILVSTGWNKNDDVFLAAETWKARNTPEDKQLNFMHDENDIMGHITGSYVLTKDGKIVSNENSSDLDYPEEFDIVTRAVLYNSWTNPENQERMKRIISEIEEGKLYVSMECLFSGFDYALIDNNGSAKIIARDDNSSFLTKHLRSYGGDGNYDGYKIGRAIKNISFSGKGLVYKPANPRSIILKSVAFEKTNLKTGDITMSNREEILEKQIAELNADLNKAKAENASIKVEIEKAKDREISAKVKAFEDKLNEKDTSIAELEQVIKSTQARVAELEDALSKSQNELASAQDYMNKMKKKEKMQKRMASLVDAGFDQDEAEQSLANFDDLSDAAFDSLVAVMKKKAAKKMQDEKMSKEKESKKMEAKESEDHLIQNAVNELQTSEASLVVSENDQEMTKTRAAISSWFENCVLNKKNKGE